MDPMDLYQALRTFPSQKFGAGASEDEIRAAEYQLEVNLQGAFREFLSVLGWGGVGDLELYGLGSDVPPHLDLVEITQSERNEMHPKLPRDLIPLMNDGGGNLYCLDTASVGPSIVFWDHEGGEAQVPDVVAPGFVEWLRSITTQWN